MHTQSPAHVHDTRTLTARRFETRSSLIRGAVICMVSVLASIELHESLHLIVGRAVGLPARFLGLTSVGIPESLVSRAAPSSLALMNGVAPVVTMILGLLALWALPRLRRGAPSAVVDFIAWWATFGVAYIGLQTMLTAAPIALRGNGADFAAVIGGYFGASVRWRTAISILGVVLFIWSGFWLRHGLSDVEHQTSQRLTMVQRLKRLTTSQVVVTSMFALMGILIFLRGAVLLVGGKASGIALLIRVSWVWAAMMGVVVDWRSDGVRRLTDRWIIPGLVASIGLWILGFVLNVDDFTGIAILLVLPLLTTAWSVDH